MAAIEEATSTSSLPWSMQLLYHRFINIFAAIMFVAIISATVLLWPVTSLGFSPDPLTGEIALVEIGSPASRAGLQVGDKILQFYNLPWEEITTQWTIFSFILPNDQTVPLTIERSGKIYAFNLVQGEPDFALQLTKIIKCLFALLCWRTGYILGRSKDQGISPIVGYYWLFMGGIIGWFFFARSTSYPLSLILNCLVIALLAPMGIYIHVRYPTRSISHDQVTRARKLLVNSILVLNISIVLLALVSNFSIVKILFVLNNIFRIIVPLGCVFVAVILQKAYKKANSAHIRRHIRIIAASYFLVAALWVIIFAISSVFQSRSLDAIPWIDIATLFIPVAYLVGEKVKDLHKLDRLVIRFSLHLTTIMILLILIAIARQFSFIETSTSNMSIALSFLGAYGLFYQAGLKKLPGYQADSLRYKPIHQSVEKFLSTLNVDSLITFLCDGIKGSFGNPAIAFYIGSIDATNKLILKTQEYLSDLSPVITSGALVDYLVLHPKVVASGEFYSGLSHKDLRTDEEQLILHPRISLWCPIHNSEGQLLGLLLLGKKGDLDPYRPEDIQALQLSIHSFSLALTNSIAYMQQRELYQRIDSTRASTAASIARRLHDEVINENIRLNIEALKDLIVTISDPALKAELELMIESEHAVAQELRIVCEELHPTGIDDPLGLSAILRMQVEKVNATWNGLCDLITENTPCPVATHIQRAALNITREALTNAVKHSQATHITVRLSYPIIEGGLISLAIQDNGQSDQIVAPKPGHWGVRNMKEYAMAVAGTLEFRQERGKGTDIIFVFPPELSTNQEDFS